MTPPEEVRDLLARRYTDIERAKWVSKDHLHVTIRFLGEIEASAVEGLQAGLREAASAGGPFSVQIAGVGTFGHPARVLWAGLEPPDELEALAAAVEEAVVRTGVPPEERPFAAHLTIARLKRSPPVMVRRFLDENRELQLPPFTVRDIQLISSVLSSSGPTHRVVEAFPLGGEASA